MKALSLFALGFLCLLSGNGLAQIDIYQSDAYSVEEMCARQAAETDTASYSTAYEACIKENRDKPMYQSDAQNAEDKLAEKGDSGEAAAKINL